MCKAKEFSRSRRRLSDERQSFALHRKSARPSITTALLPFGALAGHGWLFAFVYKGVGMAVRLPTLEQIDGLASDFGLVLTADEIAAYQEAFKGPLASY